MLAAKGQGPRYAHIEIAPVNLLASEEDQAQAAPFRLAVLDITARRQAEEESSAKTSTLAAIFESAPYIMMLVNRDGRVVDINHAGVSFAARKKNDLLGLLGGEVFSCLNSFDGQGCGRNPECSACPVRTRVERTFATGEAIHNAEGSLDVLHAGRTLRLDLLISTSPLKTPGEDMVLVSIMDISARKRAEEEKAITADVLSLINAARDSDILLRSVLERLKAWSACQAVGIRLRKGDDYPYFQTSGFPEEFVHLENHLCSRNQRGDIIRDAEGNAILDCMCGNIIQGRFDPAQSFFTAGGSFWSSCTTDLLATTSEADRQARTRNRCNGAGYESVALVPLRLGSETFGLLQFNDPRAGLFSAEKIQVFERLAKIVANCLAKLRAEEDRIMLENQLRQAQKMEAIGTLAGGIAHDFNNILAAIMGYAEMALDDAKAGRADPQDLRQIITSAARARDLVQQILAFSRKTASQFMPLNLNQKVESVVEMLARMVPKDIAIKVDLSPGLAHIKGDAGQLEQVLMNLATNARDAMPDGGQLLIQTRDVFLDDDFCRQYLEVLLGPYVLLRVSDTGQGMDARTMENMYDPFFTTKDVGKGTGLGLSIIHGIVKSHGGHIFCQSQPGRGTTFDVCLPAISTGALAPATADEIFPDLSLGSQTVLLVDDEKVLRDLGARALEGAGYKVLAAQSGEEALEFFREGHAGLDLVIMDLGMPGMGGGRCLKAMLEINPRAKVLIASGYAADGQIEAALESGAAGYVAKPYKRADLLAKVRSVLNNV
jgi:signal transduction histidine kinase/PAS domain-containing protein